MMQGQIQQAFLTSMIGREAELEQVITLLRRADVRLVTLTGTGGVGKTRLGIQVAERLREFCPDGVFFISLAETSDPAQVSVDISHDLRLDEKVGKTAMHQVICFFKERQALLVLDNFEQILPAADQVAELLVEAPGLKVLVTSREALHIGGEYEYPVPPLTLPNPETDRTPQALMQSEAVALFVARAQAVDPRFNLNSQNALIVAQICLCLDGLPLAIELAAARIKFFSPEQLLERLRHRFSLLVGGARNVPSRQQTLRATIDWSYNLLNEREKRLFAKLGVFVGGFTLEAAEAICCNDPDSTLLQDLSSLVDKSIVLRYDDMTGEARFRLLETVREYALEQLQTVGDYAPVRQRHAAFYLALAESVAQKLFSREQAHWLRRIEIEQNNLMCALEWSNEQDDALTLARLISAIGDYWHRRGCIREATYWLRSPIMTRVSEIDLNLWARLLVLGGEIALRRYDFEAAQTAFTEALDFYESVGDRSGAIEARLGLGDIVQIRGHHRQALEMFSETLDLARRHGDSTQVSRTLRSMAEIQQVEGSTQAAMRLLEEALELAKSEGDDYMTAFVLHELAYLLLVQGEYFRAFDLQMECLRLRTALVDRSNMIHSLEIVAWTICEMGLFEQAAQLFGAVERLRETTDVPSPVVKSHHDYYLDMTRQHMSAEAFESAWDTGYVMPFEAIVAWVDELPCEINVPMQNPLADFDLTPREVDVLRLLATGLTDREIAERLVISPRTVNTHLTSIYGKIGVSSRSAATRFALENRISA